MTGLRNVSTPQPTHLLHAVLDATAEAVLLCDEQGTILLANAAARRLVAAAAARGELDPDVDVRAVEYLLNAVVSGLSRLSAITGDARRHAAAVDALQRFFAGTLIVTTRRQA